MDKVLESEVRRTCTTAAGGGAAADTEEDDGPVRLHADEMTREAASRATAALTAKLLKDGLRIECVIHFQNLNSKSSIRNLDALP